jgi:hypothetical protein
MTKFSRRDFLKLTGISLAGLAFAPYQPPYNQFDDGLLGRIATTQLSIYSRPDDTSTIVGQRYRDEILNIYEEVTSTTPGYNPVWYRVWGGYIHRARVQKVKVLLNAPAAALRKDGQIGEVTVPFTQAMRLIGKNWELSYRLYYGTVHWIDSIAPGPDGAPWYGIKDELLEVIYYVPAAHIRLIKDEELAPITPEVPFQNKRIEVSIETQRLTCYEYDQPVFTTIISSGRLSSQPGPNGIPTRTPLGEYNVRVKMPSKHMGNGSLAADIEAYELPGVPWTTFFTTQGHAFHGTYWHDNFGVPMSSGCINMRNEEAKWLFRWCTPSAAMSELNPATMDRKGYGTKIVILK